MSSEFLEKIRNILEYLFVLFISILIMLITFGSLHVNAADQWTLSSNSGSYDVVVKYYNPDNKLHATETYTTNSEFFGNSNYFYGAVVEKKESYFGLNVFYYDLTTHEFHNPVFSDSVTLTQILTDDNGNIKQTGSLQYSALNIGIYLSIDSYETDLPCFGSLDSFKNYCLIGDASGLLNGGSIDNPDFEDTAYSFTGFTANNKMTANWTGTTDRSYLQDQEVEEYVRVNYYFADKDAQDTIKQSDAYPDEFATADKTLTIDVSGLKPDNENWFLRYIRITPCYRQAGLGAWGDFYHGSDVFVYFDVNGKIESIVQNSVPTDGEVIGNNISLIGFRYDTSFHAEFVDVWSNAVNCSAFDLGGSQYLSLGVKALYYNGQSKDIDFVSLDRKNLVWDKTFDSFKTFNGSGIKQLFFTPYIKTGVNNPWNKGNSIVIDFDVNGNATSSFDTGDDGTVHLSDFKLTGVVWNKPMLAYGTITWAGTTANSDMSIVPDSDTLVVCSYPVYDSSLNESYETYDTVTIGKGSIRVYIDSLIDKYTNAGKTWNGEMWLTPCYKKGGVLYMGEPVIVNCTKGTVSDIEVDESTGTANQVDKTDENKSYADAILSSGNNFFSIVKGLIASMQQLPELIATLFSFLPGWVNALIAGSIFVIFVCRILGR